MVRMAMNAVVIEGGKDKKHILYNKKGHRWIQIKMIKQGKMGLNWERVKKAEEKINRLYEQYDRVVEISIKDSKIHSTLLHLLRYYNAGNTK